VLLIGLDMSNSEYKKLWSKFDTTGLGYVTYAAFNNKVGLLIHPRSDIVLNRPETPKVKEWQRKALARGLQKKMQNLEEAFKEIDTDGSGRISHQVRASAARVQVAHG
jgi:Ca2+-binding EF-hand superfamily protein